MLLISIHLHLISSRRFLVLWLNVFRLWAEFLCLMKYQDAVYETKLCEQDTCVLIMELVGVCLTLTEQVSSHTRQRCPLYQVQRRPDIDRLFYRISCWVSVNYCYLVADFKLRRLEINLDQTVEIHKKNVDHKVLTPVTTYMFTRCSEY